MPRATILIADDDATYRETVSEYFQRYGFSVIEAKSPFEARSILEAGSVNIAIIDIRMRSSGNRADTSGLELAINTTSRIPKIINTAYPTGEYVRRALRSTARSLAPAIAFLDKAEGLEKLLEVVDKILSECQIFVIHGHDTAARSQVEIFLRQLGLTPIILQDLPNQGRVLLEKLVQSAEVSYAIALLTPDDLGRLKSGSAKLEPRARQNVILELGYFLGKLGPDRVCALCIDGIVLPSDMEGFLRIKLDQDGAWKLLLAREIWNAGIYIDLNVLLWK